MPVEYCWSFLLRLKCISLHGSIEVVSYVAIIFMMTARCCHAANKSRFSRKMKHIEIENCFILIGGACWVMMLLIYWCVKRWQCCQPCNYCSPERAIWASGWSLGLSVENFFQMGNFDVQVIFIIIFTWNISSVTPITVGGGLCWWLMMTWTVSYRTFHVYWSCKSWCSCVF